jgi:hypothetical protein
MIKILTIAAIILTIAGPVRAEPGHIEKWLMSEPVSRWTHGMSQLQSDVYGWKGKHPLAGMGRGANYNWWENRITIVVYTREPFTRAKCASILKQIRKSGGVANGRPIYGMENSTYAANFSDRGFSSKKEPKNYLKHLDRIIVVQAQMASIEKIKGGDLEGRTCEGKLLSTEVLYR